jgi:hypothetical protein
VFITFTFLLVPHHVATTVASSSVSEIVGVKLESTRGKQLMERTTEKRRRRKRRRKNRTRNSSTK